ncbi:hypothetical protein [Sinorhizobium meliloti]|uniref:hypothetical protein n=1 Tax=Rhizobium meliloti TaxID=382 RepID=UPI000FD92D1E|nr:hypothetical protein [Sinorhizobium meliloti]MDW9928055.1 hypothetical protein [Sinorhizobium meliloti]MDX0964783.1 hypothetical protein [Sinorhizobium medicae]RVI54938.1 hypothetical protein CN195_04780 [Sinorhizobium meliloti]
MNSSFRHLALACAAIVGAAALPTFAAEDHSIYYGSRSGMQLTTVSRTGIGTANAVIVVKHTPKDAKAYCVGYEMDNSMACVKRTMAEVKVGDRVTGNCRKRTWTDMYGQSYAYEGPMKSTDSMADYAVRDMKSGEILDGSSASGYGVALTIFQQLCPGIAK